MKRSSPEIGRCSAAAGEAVVIAVGMAFAAEFVDDASFRLLCCRRRPPAATPTGVRACAAGVRGSVALREGGAATAPLAEAERRRDAGIVF